MKSKFITLALLIIFPASAFAQSKSFQILKEKFRGTENVFSIRTSGFMARTVLWMAGEREYNSAIRDVYNVRLMVIPKSAFRKKEVTLEGFRKVIRKDGFEELAHMRDHGDDVTILIQSPSQKRSDNRYLLLVEENDEVVVIEVRGYIDPELMFKDKNTIAYN
jgi:hypothetical protein